MAKAKKKITRAKKLRKRYGKFCPNEVAHFCAFAKDFPAPVMVGSKKCSDEFKKGWKAALEALGYDILSLWGAVEGHTYERLDEEANNMFQHTLKLLTQDDVWVKTENFPK